MLPYSAEFEAHMLRPDATPRPIVVAQVVDKNSDGSLRQRVMQRRDDWALADGAAAGPPPTLANFQLLDNGDVRLSGAGGTIVTKGGAPTGYFTDLDRSWPYSVGLIQWGGTEPADLEIKRIKIWLNPRVSGASSRQVVKWKLDLLAVIEEKDGKLILTAPLHDSMVVDVTNDAEGLVTFDFSNSPISARPKAKYPLPFYKGGVLTFNHPTTILLVTALDKDGNYASNAGMGYAVGDVTTAGTTLSSRSFTDPGFFGKLFAFGKDNGAGAGCPLITVETETYTSQTISFTTNPLSLGGPPAGDVQLIARGHVPNGCAIVYKIRNDADSAWISYTDGQWMIADLGLTPSTTRKWQIDLVTNVAGGSNLTPILTGVGMESLSEVIFLRQTKVSGGNWAIDPQSLKGEIPEVVISFIRDGDKDYTSAIEDLLANNHIGDIRIRLYWGDESLARKDWLHDDDVLIDGSHPRGPEIRLKCLSVLCLLRDLVPRFKAGSVFAPNADVSVAGWTTDAGSGANLYQRIDETTFDDVDYIRSSLSPSNEVAEFRLPTTTDPAGRRHLVDYRFRKDATSGEQIDLTVQLRQGASTIIATQVHTNIDTDTAFSATPFTFSLTDQQIATITDYTDLRIRFIANKPSGSGARRAVVTWLEFRTGGKQDQVTYNGTLKTAFDGLMANELGIDARYRGNGIEDIQSINQVAKTMFQTAGASNKPLGKAELDALAYIAGGGLTTSQGKITFANMFSPGPVRAIFPSSEISLDEAGPGYEERMPQLFCTWKWNPAKGDFDRQEYVVHAGALLHLGQARLDPAKWFDVEMAKWLQNEGLDANGVSLAGRIGVRQVQAIGPGLMLWPFIANYRYPWLRPGDVIQLQTDKFVGRDPNVSRAIRGQQWVTAVIQSRDSSARRFTAWVRNYSDMLATPFTGDRNGLGPATPHIMSITPDAPDSGAATAIIACAGAASVRVAVSTSSEPSAATVRGAPLQQLDSAGVLRTGTLATLIPGQTLYIAALGYEKADGSAAESPLVAAQAAMRYLSALSVLSARAIWRWNRLFVQINANTGVGSMKVATNLASYPAVGAGASTDGAEILFDAGVFNFGDQVYITITPYAGAGASGSVGPILQLRTRLASFPNPDFDLHQMLANANFADGLVLFRKQAGNDVVVVTDSTKAYSGNNYLQVTSTTGVQTVAEAADDAGASRYFEVNPGDVVQWGGRAYRESGTDNVNILLQTSDKDKASPANLLTPNQNTANWLLVQGQYIVPAGVKFVRWLCQADGSGTATVARFGQVFLRIAVSKSTALNPQGSILPVALAGFLNYTTSLGAAKPWIAFDWAVQSLPMPDGSILTIPANTAMAVPGTPTLTEITPPPGVTALPTGVLYHVRVGYIKNQCIVGISAEATINHTTAGTTIGVNVPAPPAGSAYDGWCVLIDSAVDPVSLWYTSTPGSNTLRWPSVIDPCAVYGSAYALDTGGRSGVTTAYDASWNTKCVVTHQYNNGAVLAYSTSEFFYPFFDFLCGVVVMAGACDTAANPTLAAIQQADAHYPLGGGNGTAAFFNVSTPAFGAGTPITGGGAGGRNYK